MILIYGKRGWESPRMLRNQLDDARYLSSPRVPRRLRRVKLVVNYGNTEIPFHRGPLITVLNPPSGVKVAANKLLTFDVLKACDIRTPAWTESRGEAANWLRDGRTVYARTILTGKGGAGIRVLRGNDPLIEAPLYTRFVKSDYEARAHVFKNKCIGVSKKIRIRPETAAERGINTEGRYWVRSHDNGWVFSYRTNIQHDDAELQAVMAVDHVGLDFGAVDVLIRGDKAYVLEVNSAPGLSPSTCALYAEQIKEFYNAVE